MRLLKTTKPIPVRYLKSGKDNGAYDQVRLLWLPGRTTPIRVPDMKLAGVKRGGVAPSIGTAPLPATSPTRKGTGLLLPTKRTVLLS